MKRTIYIFLLLLPTICNGQTLSEIARELNKSLPSKNEFVSIKSVSFSKNQFILNAEINVGKQFNLIYYKSKPKEAKEWCKAWTMITYKKSAYMFNRMIEKNVDFVIHLRDIKNIEDMNVVLTPYDLKDAIKKYASLDSDELQLTCQCIATNIQSPQQIDEITFITGAKLTSTSLENYYLVDDEFFDFKDLEEEMDNLKFDILEEEKSTLNGTFVIQLLIKTGRSLKYVYTGKKSKLTFPITVSVTELKALLNNEKNKLTHNTITYQNLSYKNFLLLQYEKTPSAMTDFLKSFGYSFYKQEPDNGNQGEDVDVYSWIKMDEDYFSFIKRHYKRVSKRFMQSFVIGFSSKKEAEKFLSDALADGYEENNMANFDNDLQEELEDYLFYYNHKCKWMMFVKQLDNLYKFEICDSKEY